MLQFLTAGESHGPALTTIIEGLPAGLALPEQAINAQLRRRQGGYGRGGRQKIERDQVRFLGGIYQGHTTGAPVSMLITNRDFENWRERVVPPWTKPRPGHADLPGSLKYGIDDMRLIAERASARETAARVAAGAVAEQLLAAVGASIGSYVESIGSARANVSDVSLDERLSRALESDVACPDPNAAAAMRREIDRAREQGDSLGGVICVVAQNLPVGLGSHVQWDRRLDGRIAQAIMSIQAVKGVEIGPAFENATLPGTLVHDPLLWEDAQPARRANRAGGLEGGMTNGEPVLVRLAMKPIPTTVAPIETIDMATGESSQTEYSRSDVCAVPAAAVVAEAMLATVLANAVLERYGADRMDVIVEGVCRDRS